MNRKFQILTFFILFSNSIFGQNIYQKDFNKFWNDINENYAYLDQQKIDWKKVKEIYEPNAAEIKNNSEFISFLENVLNGLYNGHSSLNTNLDSSNKLILSGQDIYVEKLNNDFIITDLMKNFRAEKSGLK